MRIHLVIIHLFIWQALIGQNKQTPQDYIQKYNQLAVAEMKRVGIPASITLAQGMLESENGNSSLAIKANNHFGIKCHKDWNGNTYYQDDDSPNECFRKYKTVQQSYTDHSDFLTNHQRYAFLFDYGTVDYKKWAHGLKKAGYATNKSYAELLIKIIEENELYRFDDGSYKKERPLAKRQKSKVEDIDLMDVDPFGNDIQNENRINFIIVRQGDTFKTIADRYALRPWQLYKYNEIDENAKLTPGQRLYLQPKRRKADINYKYHVVQEGEDLWAISQMYGIKLKHMYRLNGMLPGTKLVVGQKLSLRRKIRQKDINLSQDTETK